MLEKIIIIPMVFYNVQKSIRFGTTNLHNGVNLAVSRFYTCYVYVSLSLFKFFEFRVRMYSLNITNAQRFVFVKYSDNYCTVSSNCLKMPPAGNKCSYKNCGKSQRSNPGLHMFSFPVKNEEICKQWILNSGGNTDLLDMPPSDLKKRRICENHFETSAFVNVLRQRLNRNSVPIPIGYSSATCDFEPLCLTLTKNPKRYDRLTTTMNTTNLCSSSTDIFADTGALSPTLQRLLDLDGEASRMSTTSTTENQLRLMDRVTNNQYAVVEFPRSECAVVPFLWVIKSNQACFWPKNESGQTLRRLIEDPTPPSPSWPVVKLVKVYFTHDNLKSAEASLNDLILESIKSENGASETLRRLKILDQNNCKEANSHWNKDNDNMVDHANGIQKRKPNRHSQTKANLCLNEKKPNLKISDNDSHDNDQSYKRIHTADSGSFVDFDREDDQKHKKIKIKHENSHVSNKEKKNSEKISKSRKSRTKNTSSESSNSDKSDHTENTVFSRVSPQEFSKSNEINKTAQLQLEVNKVEPMTTDSSTLANSQELLSLLTKNLSSQSCVNTETRLHESCQSRASSTSLSEFSNSWDDTLTPSNIHSPSIEHDHLLEIKRSPLPDNYYETLTDRTTPTFTNRDWSLNNPNSSFEENVINALNGIIATQNQTLSRINHIYRILNNNRVKNYTTIPDGFPTLPIDKKVTFKEVEMQLRETSKFNYLKNRLAAIGGSSVRLATNNVLKYVLTNKMAKRFNWLGHNNKKPFKSTKLWEVVREAIYLQFSDNKSTDLNDAVIVKAIQDWLRLAPQRYTNEKPKIIKYEK